MTDWRRGALADLKRLGMDGDAVLAHLAAATHLRRPAAKWRKQLTAIVFGAEAIAVLLRPFTPAGTLRPTSADTPAAFGAVWAALEFPTPELLGVVSELVPWCHAEFGTSHQVAFVGVMALGVWPADTRRILEQLRADPAMSTLDATVRAALRRQNEAHPK